MTSERWEKVKENFLRVVDLPTAERVDFFEKATNGDEEMRREVEKLLASDESADEMFENLSFISQKTFLEKDRIGNYNILEKIGTGGMGAVYLAQRVDLPQKVALKIIRRDADSEVILKRFRREQEILAALEHPNIARLLDVGVSADGLPFLAMEYVEGRDLISYCRQNDLSIGEKLNLFRKVCEAVSYAHSRLVVHRDLKPSNILVNRKGEPKLLDFGISKLLSGGENSDKGTVTSFGMLTPNYASPEQFRGETVSTATDIYSLGVILYEILTDALPYDVTDRRIDEVARAVCETNPQKPSEAASKKFQVQRFKSQILRFGSEAGTSENEVWRTTNRKRRIYSKFKIQNSKLLKGDLDNIVLKALRKEPERRYSSVEKFSEDLRRHLEGLPVTARRDTFSYRAEKFIRRNRVSVISAALIFFTLLGGAVGISRQYIRAERERKLAEQRFKQIRALANNVVFKYYDEIKNLQGATKAREMLITDATAYLDNLSGEAEDVSLQRELARAYMRVGDVQGEPYQANLGDTAGAIESYRKAIALLENALQKSFDLETKRELRQAVQQLGALLLRAGDKNVLETVKQAVEISEQIVASEPNNTEDKLYLAKSYVYLGDNSLLGTGENESVGVFRNALKIVEPVAQTEPENTNALYRLTTLNQRLGFHYGQMGERAAETGKTGEAREFFRRASPFYHRTIELSEKLSALEPQNANYRRNASVARFDEAHNKRLAGESEKVLPILLEVLSERKAASFADEKNVQAIADLSEVNADISLVYLQARDFQLAVKFALAANSAIDEAVRRDPNNNEYKGGQYATHLKHGDILAAQNDFEQAIEIYRNAFEQFAKTAGARNRSDFGLLESTMHGKIGDAENALSEKSNLSPREKRAKLDAAQREYQKAIASIEAADNSQNSVSLRNAERCAYLKQKLAHCETKLASL